jgi:hypothetical protein
LDVALRNAEKHIAIAAAATIDMTRCAMLQLPMAS